MARTVRRNVRAKAQTKVGTLKERVSNAFSWTPSTMVTLGLIVIGFFSVGPQLSEYFTMQTQIAQLQANLDSDKKNLDDIKAEKKRWDDPVFIRAQARDRLFYVVPGEVSYLVLDADGINTSDTSGTVGAMLAKQKNNGEISKNIATTKHNWAASIQQSIIQAGLDQPSEAKNPATASK
jgi:cell division protein FtsB